MMTKRLEFSGIVQCGHACRVADEGELDGAIHIGGADVVDDISEYNWPAHTRIILNGQLVATGSPQTTKGWGYSEYTPIENDEVSVGGFDLIAAIEALEGHECSLVIDAVGNDCSEPSL